MSALDERLDAIVRFARSSAQAIVVTAGTGAVAGVDELVGSGDTVTLETVSVAALVGAGVAVTAWAQRRLEGYRDRRRAAASGESEDA